MKQGCKILLLLLMFFLNITFNEAFSDSLTYQQIREKTQEKVNKYRETETEFEYGDYIFPVLQKGLDMGLTHLGENLGEEYGPMIYRQGGKIVGKMTGNPILGPFTGYLYGKYKGPEHGRFIGRIGGMSIASGLNTAWDKYRDDKKFQNQLFLQDTLDGFQQQVISLDEKINKVINSDNLADVYNNYESLFFDKSKVFSFEGITEKEKQFLKAGKFELENETRQRKVQELIIQNTIGLKEKTKELSQSYQTVSEDLKLLRNKYLRESKEMGQSIYSLTLDAENQTQTVTLAMAHFNERQEHMENILRDLDPNVDKVTKLIRKRREQLSTKLGAKGETHSILIEDSFLYSVEAINEGLDSVSEYLPAAQFLSNVGVFDEKTSEIVNGIASTVSSLKGAILPALMTGGVSGYFMAANAAISLFSKPQKDVKHEMYMKAFESLLGNQKVMNEKLDVLIKGQEKLYKQNLEIMSQISNLQYEFSRLGDRTENYFDQLQMSVYDMHFNYQVDQLANFKSCFSKIRLINDHAVRENTYEDFKRVANGDVRVFESFDDCFSNSFSVDSMLAKKSVFYESGVSHIKGIKGEPSHLHKVFEKWVELTFGNGGRFPQYLTLRRYRYIPALDYSSNSIYGILAKHYAIREDNGTFRDNFIPDNDFYHKIFPVDEKRRTFTKLDEFSRLYNAETLVEWSKKLLNFMNFYPFLDIEKTRLVDFGQEKNETRVKSYIEMLKKSFIPTLNIAIKQQTLLSGDMGLYTLYLDLVFHELTFQKMERQAREGTLNFPFTDRLFRWELASRFANLYDESDRQRMKDRIFMLKHSPALRKNLNMYVWHYVFKSDSDKYSEFYQNLEDREKTQQFLYENELGYVFKTDEVETTLLLKDLTGGENCSSNKSRWYFSWAGLRGVNIEEFVSEAEIKDDDVKPDDVTKRFVKQGDSIKNTSIVFCLPTPEEFKAGTYIISKELETLTKVRDEAIQLASEMEVYLEEKIIKGKNLSESFYNDKFNNLRALAIIKD